MKIGSRLKALRKKYKYSRQDVADKIGVPLSTYGRWENDTSEPSYSNLEKIAGIYGVTIGSLFDVNDNDILPNNIKDNLLTSVVTMLVEDGLIDKDRKFNELDEDVQNMIMGALNKFISNIAEEKDSSQ